jgi:haloacetate dehalogenase
MPRMRTPVERSTANLVSAGASFATERAVPRPRSISLEPPTHMLFPGFESRRVHAEGSTIFLRIGGAGPAVLLLHGFPETHLAWRKVAPRLSASHTIVAADLPGYGDSRMSRDSPHAAFDKRGMARTLVGAMSSLGFSRFAVVGHDRGARAAYRMALDYPDRIEGLAVCDVISTLDIAERTTYATARQMANWFWLAQREPVPERTIAADPRAYVTDIVKAWGGADAIEAEILDEYVRCFTDPDVVHAVCEEYRAGDTVDIENDRSDRAAGRKIACPMLVLWVQGGFASQFGDPVAIWKQWANDVRGTAIRGRHFMLEESPDDVAEQIESFLARMDAKG